jgi:hypothetical protein
MKTNLILKKIFLSSCLLTVMGMQAQTFPTFTEVTPTGEGVRNDLFRGHAIWGDFDNDGYYEAIVFSTDGDWGYDAFFLENESGALTRLNFPELGLPDFTNDRWDWSFAWIDYNNDGWMDLLFVGRQGSEGVAELYKNNGTAVDGTTVKRFTLVENTGITGLQLEEESNYMSRIAVGDYNNDGYADIMLTGYTGPSEAKIHHADLYKNEKGAGKFALQAMPVDWLGDMEAFATASGSTVILTDLNNDGYLDVILNGWNNGPKVNIYQNDGDGAFFGDYLFNPSFRTGDGDIAVGDFNNDGKMDILLTGASQNTKGIQGYPDWLSKSSLHLFNRIDPDFNEIVYTEIMSAEGLTDLQVSGIDVADLNADGKLDFLAAGAGGDWPWEAPTTTLCLNRGDNTFEQPLTAFPGLRGAPSVSFADYDNDGYLDVMLLGYGNSATFKVYKNDGNLTKNTAPSAPQGLTSSYDSGSGKWTFSWDAGNDAETPAQSLRYNLFVKLPGTGGEVFTNIPADIETGYLKSTRHNTALTATAYNMELPFEKFEWGVQTIDQGKLGSTFATATTSVEASSIGTPTEPKACVYTSNSSIYINSNSPATVTIYNANGEQMASTGNVTTNKAIGPKLSKGVYLVKVQMAKDSKIFKVIL